jgi:hypothetical protein
MDELAALKPTGKFKVFDLVEQAGYDMSDWIGSASDPRKYRANPKYCYNWSFIEPGRLVVFNLWHGAMREEPDGSIVHSENYRGNAEYHRDNGGKVQWIARGFALDAALKAATRPGVTVRVIIVDGVRRRVDDVDSPSSRVTARELDPSPWHLRRYDWDTGAFVLARGAAASPYADQFDLGEEASPRRRETNGSVYVRDPAVRRSAMARAGGVCQLCGEAAFEMANGQRYLETHHILPLSEGGGDELANVIALCPNDHRRAHHASDRQAMRDVMLAIARSDSAN